MTATPKAARDAALRDLDTCYGEAYDLAVTRAGWIAKRLDSNRAMVAVSPEKLRQKIEADVSGSGSDDRVRAGAGSWSRSALWWSLGRPPANPAS
jgi:hypothetical protein